MDIKSERSKLITDVLQDYLSNTIFDSINSLKNLIELELSKKIEFETKVSDIDNTNGYFYGEVIFADEVGDKRVLAFTVFNENTQNTLVKSLTFP
jgi:hypothetical protein